MESLTTSVYECSLPVEAHMICDLLARAGISARVDGEFLAGAGGELPLGNTIKVRVSAARAAEAREVIAEWERQNPPDASTPPPVRRAIWRSPLWFAAGAVVGAGLMFLALRTPATSRDGDTDGDGIVDETFHYNGEVLARVEYDRNADRKVDERWFYDSRGIASRREADEDFDGVFELVKAGRYGEVPARLNAMSANADKVLVPESATKLKATIAAAGKMAERGVARSAIAL
jgi:hypothetical protein